MSQLWVHLNYRDISEIVSSLRSTADMLEERLDEVVKHAEDVKPWICTKPDCPHRTVDYDGINFTIDRKP